jgi:DNA-directed RNA polymerase specialized sigma24 family protein
MEKQELYRLIDALKKLRLRREQQVMVLKERIHCQFYRCLSLEKRILTATPGMAYYEKLKKLFRRAKQRRDAAQKRLAGTRLDATNQQIAEVLGIPKGTVDSALHAVREKSKAAGLLSPASSLTDAGSPADEGRYSRN